VSLSPPDRETEPDPSYLDGWSVIYNMIRQGMSWSGWEPNSLFLNTGGGRFADASAVLGLDFTDDGRAIAVVDWDQDGALDLWVTSRSSPRLRFLHNRLAGGRHFVALRLRGVECNRDAVGARVDLYLAGSGRRLVRTVFAGDGFLGQSSKWLHFGLGDESEIERVVVTWPGGVEEEIAGIAADGRFELVQGSGRARPCELPARAVALEAGANEPVPPPAGGRAVLSTRLPLPRITYRDEGGAAAEVRTDGAGATFVTLWASWCAPCRSELEALVGRASDLEARGVELLALSVDEGPARAEARAILERLGWRGGSGFAGRALFDLPLSVEEIVLEPQRPLVVPMSVLIDGRHRLVAIYRGPVDPDTLLHDAAAADASPLEVRASAQPFPGRWLSGPRRIEILGVVNRLRERGYEDLAGEYLERLRVSADASGPEAAEAAAELANSYLVLADDLAQGGRKADALTWYERATELAPERPEGQRGLGVALLDLGRTDEALAHIERAVALDPSDGASHYALGVIYGRLANLDQAARHFELAIAADPDNHRAHYNLGAIRGKQGRVDEALACTRRALEIEPDYWQARRTLASMLHSAGDLPAAIEEYRRALALRPDDERSVYGLGIAHATRGELAQAREQYERLKSMRSNYAQQLFAALRRLERRDR